MKKVIVLLVVIAITVSMAGCATSQPAETAPSAAADAPAEAGASAEVDAPAEEPPAESSVATDAAATSSGEIKLQWFQQMGIDTLFESPWRDQQSLYPYMVFEALISQKSDGTYMPKLASDYSVSDDGMSYTFTIRDGVTWHDGQPFTAEDVVWSLSAGVADPNATQIASRLVGIEGADAVKDGTADTLSGVTADGNQVTVKLSYPNNGFLDSMSMFFILPKHLLGDVAPVDLQSNTEYWSKPVGTGAYKIDEVSFPDYFTAVANDDYWGSKPGIPKALFTSYNTGGNDAVVADLIAGNLDFGFKNALNDIAVADNITAQNPDMVSKLIPSNYTRFLVFNIDTREDGNNKADLKNETVRQAFNLLLDKEAMAGLYSGQAVALSTLANPETNWYNKDIPLFTRDVDTAVSMLNEAGFDFSQTIDIAYYYDDQATADLMDIMVQNFKEAGINVKTTLLSGDLATLIYGTSNFDLIYCAYAGAVNPIEMYQSLTSDTPYTFIGDSANRTEKFDDLWKSFLAATDQTGQIAIGDEFQAASYQSAYIIPIYSLSSINIYNASKISIPDDIFEFDYQVTRDWQWEKWSIVG